MNKKPNINCDGRSLIPQILNGPQNQHAQKGKEVVFSQVLRYTMVRNKRYKLVVRTQNLEPVEFYDLKNDPKEVENKVNDSTLQQIKQELIDSYISKILDHPKND